MDKVVYFKGVNDDDMFCVMAYIQVATDIIEDVEAFLKNKYGFKSVEVLEVVETIWKVGDGWNTSPKKKELERRYKGDPCFVSLCH